MTSRTGSFYTQQAAQTAAHKAANDAAAIHLRALVAAGRYAEAEHVLKHAPGQITLAMPTSTRKYRNVAPGTSTAAMADGGVRSVTTPTSHRSTLHTVRNLSLAAYSATAVLTTILLAVLFLVVTR